MADFNPSMRVVYKLPAMEQAVVKKDIAYKTVEAGDLKMDVYYPANFQGDKPLPAILFVHGDGPDEMLKDAKDWGQYVSWGQLIAASGLIGVTSNHRSTRNLTAMREVGADIDDLINYVRTEAASLNIDKEQLGLWVASAGTPYGLCAALRDKPEFIRCVIAYYGIIDWYSFRQYYPAISEETLLEFSPMRYLAIEPEKIAPLLVVKAAFDRPQLNDTINQFVADAVMKNVTLDFLTHPQGQHGFDVLDDNPISHGIIKRTLDFIRNTYNSCRIVAMDRGDPCGRPRKPCQVFAGGKTLPLPRTRHIANCGGTSQD